MKRLGILFILTCLLSITSFSQNICSVCEGLINKTNIIDRPEINMELVDSLQDTIDICKLSVDTNNISINISFIKNFFETEDNLSACENDIANCKFFMADSESTIAKYGIEDSVMKNIEYPINDFDEIYILQKDKTYCRIFKINAGPTEDEVSFDITVDGEKTICPGENVELKVDFQEDSLSFDDYTYKWKKDDVIVSNDTILTVNTSGSYYLTVTSNINLCSSTAMVDINYRHNNKIQFENESGETIEDTITTCIGNEVFVKARPDFSELENDYVWELDTNINNNILNFIPIKLDTINSTLILTSDDDYRCEYTFNVPTIKVIDAPIIDMVDIDIPEIENCDTTVTITVELLDATSDLTYQLLKDGEPLQMPQVDSFFNDIQTGLNYSIVIDNGICNKDTSDVFNIIPTNIPKPAVTITRNGGMPQTDYDVCNGDNVELKIENDNFTDIEWKPSISDSSMDNPFSFTVNAESENLLIVLSYIDGMSNCPGIDSIELIVNQLRIPTVALTINDKPINEVCEGEIFTLSTVEDFDAHYWEIDNQTSTNSEFEPERIDENTEYSLIVEDKGCKSNEISGSIKVTRKDESAVKIQENYPVATDSSHTTEFCFGGRAIYRNDNDQYKFSVINKENNITKTYTNENNNFIIIEWNEDDTLTLKASSGDDVSRCAGNEIPITIVDEAPTGKIDSFGNNSNTYVVNHSNEIIDSFEWFTLDENGTYEALGETGKERILDCDYANCDPEKILGVKITSGNCSNLLFVEGSLELVETSIEELSTNNIFNISPSLNSGEFYFTFKTINPLKKYHLSVYNISGKNIYNTAIKQKSANFVSIANASPGVYLAVIKDGQQPVAQQKLIIY